MHPNFTYRFANFDEVSLGDLYQAAFDYHIDILVDGDLQMVHFLEEVDYD